MEDQIQRIADKVKVINKTVTDYYDDLLEYTIEEIISRVLLYLNHDELAEKFEYVIVNIVDGIFRKYKANLNNGDVETAISSMSDNGQSVSFADGLRNYLSTSADNELFCGAEKVLSRYRRISVAGS